MLRRPVQLWCGGCASSSSTGTCCTAPARTSTTPTRRRDRARGPRGTPVLPGPLALELPWVHAGFVGGGPLWWTASGARARDRLPARHRRRAAPVRGRPLRGLRRPSVHGAHRGRGRALRGRRRRRARGGRAGGHRPGAGQPPRDGPGDPRPRPRRALHYAAKIHGGALEYTVKPVPPFYEPFAVESSGGQLRGVPVGSRHTAESLWAEMDDPALPPRTRLGPPGVDVARFAPRDAEAAQRGLEALRARLVALLPDTVAQAAAGAAAALATGAAAAPAAAAAVHRRPRRATPRLRPPPTPRRPPRSTAMSPRPWPPWTRRARRPADRVRRQADRFQGVELLLAAFPLVLAREPRARLLIVGFGAFRPGLERPRRNSSPPATSRRPAQTPRPRTAASCRN